MDAATRQQAQAVHADFLKHFNLASFPLWHLSLRDGFSADGAVTFKPAHHEPAATTPARAQGNAACEHWCNAKHCSTAERRCASCTMCGG